MTGPPITARSIHRCAGLVGRLGLVACCLGALPVAAQQCAPAGGAPGASPAGIPPGGAIGPGVGGTGVDAFVAALAGEAPAPPPPACGAPAPLADASAQAATAVEPAALAPPGLDRSAGNPVDVATGNRYHRQPDVVLPHPESSALSPDGPAAAFGLDRAGPLVLQLARHYNSRSDFALSLGRGWSHSFDTRLARIVRDGRVELQILQADGRRLVFRSGGGRVHRTGRIADGLVDEHPGDAAASFVWRWPGGRRVVFDAAGRLVAMVAADLDAIRLRRDAEGRLLEAADNAGRVLGFEYAAARLTALRLPDGQRIAYDYDTHGQLAAVRYPDGRTQRYHYEDPRAFHLLTGITDTDGRRSRHAYDDAFRVVRSQGLGDDDARALRFVYRVPRRAGETGLTEVRAGDRVSRFRWIERRGELPVLVASEGDGCARCPPVGLRAALDRHGRVTALGALTIRRDALGRVVERRIAIGARRPAWAERLRYDHPDPLAGPTLIERPSVVTGRTVRIAIGYGERGQLASVGVAGFAPGREAPVPVEAALRLRYAHAGAAIGKLVAIERDGGASGVVRTVFVHDGQRRLVRIGHAAVLAHRIERDAIGRAIAEHLPDGSRRTRAFDPGWRLASTSLRGAGLRIDYDAAGRPQTVEWSRGERWRFHLDRAGLEIVSNHGWRHRFAPVARGAIPGAGAGGRALPRPAGLPVALARAEPGRRQLVDAAGRRTEFLDDDLGRLVELRSSHAGASRRHHDALGRLARIEHADGAVELRDHDLAGRVTRREQVLGEARIVTRFGYDGARLVAIDHPVQRSLARHDAHGRLVELVHERPGGAVHRQSFAYDPLGRLVTEGLPDGSRLAHRYDAQGRPEALGLSPAGSDAVRWLVRRLPGSRDERLSLALGNGLRFEQRVDAAGRPTSLRWLRPDAGPAAPAARPWAALAPADLPFRDLQWHAAGVPVSIVHEAGEDRYAHDRFGRLIARERHAGGAGDAVDAPPEHVEYFLHDAAGDRVAARRRDGSDWFPAGVRPDASGRPTRHGALALRYGPQRRIVEAGDGPGVTRYRYDASGARAAVEGPAGARGFLHRAGRLLAETGPDGRVLRQYLHWGGRLVAVLDHAPSRDARPGIALHWVHADHLGAPIAVTDEAARVVWRGDWDAFGRLARERGDFVQPLRLAGQYFDSETGLHDNVSRSYDPDAGRYLEPDPLGLAAGLNPFSYADGSPLAATDPFGLILFAFDGTGQEAGGRNGEDISNVRKFFELYQDPAKWYMAGVGREDGVSGIAGGALDWVGAVTARARVDWMLGVLDGFLGDAWIGQTVPVDVIGFSRGAAMARDFVNRVAALVDEGHFWARGICVDLRFLGIWDTVAQFGVLGTANGQWQLAIPSAVRATFHAVALNEHRGLFPLESALGGNAWVIERGFIGDHSDVGGGSTEGDLSDVSLVWMTQMAKAMGLPLAELAPGDRSVTRPILHSRNYSALGDRVVYRRDASGRLVERRLQRRAVVPGMSWRDTAAFLVPGVPIGLDRRGQPSIVGAVDMRAYAAWLKRSYGIEVGY